MTANAAVIRAHDSFRSGEFFRVLSDRVAYPTESQNAKRRDVMIDYLNREIGPAFAQMGFSWCLLQNDKANGPFLFAQRIEDPNAPTVFSYGHGDVVLGYEDKWDDGLSP